ncbi:MAG: hypothetical protein AB200_01740 [Parcubacteria bacterium C7867-005]|nr:MAG: hypothetical protein AB200_01740 [Parcubacteria bacterium C7867-005]
MRILVITQKIDEEDDILGFFSGWVKALSAEADFVDVICLAKGKFDLPANVRVRSLGKEKSNSKFIRAIKFFIYSLGSLIKADGVFVHMAPEYVRAIHPVNFFLKKPVVMWYAHIKVSNAAKWAIDHVDFILTPSKESFEYDSDKVISTGHGINTDLFSPQVDVVTKPLSLLSFSRISKVKRIEILIEATRILVHEKNIKNLIVDIYGKPARLEDDEYLMSLKKLVVEKKVEQNVFWKGGIANKDAPKIYANHQIFVRLQGGGGFGKTELEAMAVGVPAILPTTVYKDDLKDFVSDLYFKEDDALMLSSCVERVLGWTDEHKEKYVTNSVNLVSQKHNVKNVAHTVISLLEKASRKATM